MPFILRNENTTDNPPLAVPYGKQITAGKLVYYLTLGGRTRCILFLGEGEMDGIDRVYFNGEILSEYAGDPATSERYWRFHPGTITKQIVPIDVTAISGATLTLASNPYTVGEEVSISAGVDPTPTPYPGGIKQHQKLFVVASSGNTIQLSASSGGSALVWTSSAYLLNNLRIYKANAGFFDPIQGRPQFFQEIDYTFSGIAYLEVNLPTTFSEIQEVPDLFKIYVRGKKVQNYTSTGLIADVDGVAYPDQNNLPAQTKFYSSNNALIAVDIILNYMKVKPSRIDWETFVAYRNWCDALIDWNSGNIETYSTPTWTLSGLTLQSNGALTGTGAAISTQSINRVNNIKVGAVYRGGHAFIGLTKVTSPNTSWASALYTIHVATTGVYTGKTVVLKGGGGEGLAPLYISAAGFAQPGDLFEIEIKDNKAFFYKNSAGFHLEEGIDLTSSEANPIRATAVLVSDGRWEDLKFFPLTGVTTRGIKRFTADLAFPQEIDSVVALEQVLGRSPGCHWQDVNGKIKFIVGSVFKDPTSELDVEINAGDRLLAGIISYDPTQDVIKSNIVADSFSSYKKTADEKQNFLRVEFRDIDDPYFTKKYSFSDRPKLRDYIDTLVDFGIVQVGVMTQSLADRMGEAILRWNSDLDLFVKLRGLPNTYALAKGDIVQFAHEVPGWTLETAPFFIIIDEVFEPESADEKSYILQIYNSDFYTDSGHGAITGSLPTQTNSALSPPPTLDDLNLEEGQRLLPDGTNVPLIRGTVVFDNAYGARQRARIYWKRPSDTEYSPTNLVLEQPEISVTEMNFELNFAPIGTNAIKVVTESVLGVLSTSQTIQSITIAGSTQLETVAWEQMVNSESIGGLLFKTTGSGAWDAKGISTKAIHHGDAYLRFVLDSTGKWISVGFQAYKYESGSGYAAGLNNLYGIQCNVGQLIYTYYNEAQTSSGYVAELNDTFKIEIVGATVNYYLIRTNETILLRTAANLYRYPLHVAASIYTPGAYIPSVEVYGALEQTTGLPVHWTRVINTSFNTDEVITKIGTTGWYVPQAAGAYSFERFSGNFALEFTATEINTYRFVGLSTAPVDITSPGQLAYAHFKYSLYLKGDTESGFVEVRENHGSGQVTLNANSYATGDIFRIERTDGVITYRKNGVILYTSATQYLGDLNADSAFYEQNSSVSKVRIKKAGVFVEGNYPYPIYWIENLRVSDSRPQQDGQVFYQLAASFPRADLNPILRAKVRVFNMFGAIVSDPPEFTYTGNGILASGYHNRAYADPVEQAVYRVQVDNGNGYSDYAYLKNGVTTFTPPAFINEDNIPKNLAASVIDHTKINLIWSFGSEVNIWRKSEGGSWVQIESDMDSGAPYSATGLNPNTQYEFKVAGTGNPTIFSNIVSAKTLQAPLPAETYPAPMSLVCSQNSTAPTTSVDLTWSRGSTTNTDVEVYRDGALVTTLGATITSYTDTGRSPGTTYTYKVRNKYAGSNYSAYSNECPVTTAVVQSSQRPTNLTAQAMSYTRIMLQWVNNGASGSNVVEYSDDGSSWATLLTVASSQNYANDTTLSEGQGRYYRVYNTAVAGYTNVVLEFTPIFIDTSCVFPDTWIMCAFDIIKKAMHVKEGDEILTVRSGGAVETSKVRSVIRGKADKLYIISLTSGQYLKCSASHPIIISKDLLVKPAYTLKEGDSVLTYNPLLEKVEMNTIESIEVLKSDFDVITFEMEDKEHTFISNYIVSHNIERKQPI